MRSSSRVTTSLAFAPFVLAACGPDKKPTDAGGPPPAAGGTGAFGVVTVGGKQKMYLPQMSPNDMGDPVVSVIDVGVAGNGVQGAPALIATIDLGAPPDGGFLSDYATATGGDASTIIAVSTVVPTIWFIDPTTDQLIGSTSLDSTYGQSSFSGGGGFVTGVAIDSANHRAILSVWNGFAIVDLSSRTITSVIQAPPSENFGFDSVHQRIVAPFYDCSSSQNAASMMPAACNDPKGPDGTTVIAAGLNVVDLSDQTVYTFETSLAGDGGTASPTSPVTDPNTPVGAEPDSAAIDPTTGVAVIPSEGDDFQNIIDFSQARFDKTTKTVTAPQRTIAQFGLTGVAIEPTRHLAFWEEEHGNDVAVADLAQANAGSGAWVHGLIPAPPATSGFGNLGDPHGIAVTTSITSSGPVGFVVDSGLRWVARVDLAKMLANEQGTANTELDETQMTPYVTFLDGATKE